MKAVHVLFFVFILLKLTGLINWSWWVTLTAALWAPVLFILLALVCFDGAMAAIKTWEEQNAKR